ncbi:MAG: amino acid ABC transporter permease [Leptolyngbyaceae cyanobacterium bins.302]|nr:amino acid ABC transporter permease [Leptolyngbyaceae cyanobacterium bins.302]
MTPEPLPRPAQPSLSLRHWLKRNLFDGWFNSFLTIALLILILWAATNLLQWAITQAQWTVVTTNLRLFLVGRYPIQQIWRVWVVLAIVVSMIGLSVLAESKKRRKRNLASRRQEETNIPPLLHPPTSPRTHSPLPYIPIAFVLILWLLAGSFGLPKVGTNLWGGLLLTLIVAMTSTLLAFPFGVLLALGRQSSLPVLQGFCTAYIEIVRGLPLIGILFMAQVMLPLVLPGQPSIDRVIRAIVGLVLFNAAYLAESVRGGLQSIPRGQTEAARALGLNLPLTLYLIILPQALRIAIPAIVGQFISLFKDTSLLALFALLELTGIGRSILAQPQFLGRYAEVYLFVGLIYWVFCYTLSTMSRRIEGGNGSNRRLHTSR